MNAQQTYTPLTLELSLDVNSEEISRYREAISQSASQEDWERSAITFFRSLRDRRSRYQVRQIGKGYNAVL